jgi:hypothetical protein
MSYAEAYQDTFGQLTPEPTPVMISHDVCPHHGFNLISVPRDRTASFDVSFKCPLRVCSGK